MWSGVRWFRIAAVGLAALPGRGVTAGEDWPHSGGGLGVTASRGSKGCSRSGLPAARIFRGPSRVSARASPASPSQADGSCPSETCKAYST